MQGLTRKWENPPATNPANNLRDRILQARGMTLGGDITSFLNPTLMELEDPANLSGANEAAKLIANALRENKKILIFGDYDADGITASTVLYHVISAATGEPGPPIFIPNRLEDGYGISTKAIEKFAETGVDLIVTVDCGITAIEAAHRAKELGLTLIITDHHKPREDGVLPSCEVIVHPSLDMEPTTPFAGVGVAYQLAWAFARSWSESAHVNQNLKDVLLEMIPVVAIGTIADMVPLINSNRILVRWGLQLLPITENEGLRAIMDELKTPSGKLDTSHISFGVAPLINAAGRLSQAAEAVDLLTHLKGDLALGAAKHLLTVNRERQQIQRAIVDDSVQQIEDGNLDQHNIIILKDDSWARGVVGVAAGKCIERFYRPIILFSGEGNELIGSARSIRDFSIFEALCACKEHIVKFGGHDMAAGLTVKRESFDAFVSAMREYAEKNITKKQLIKSVQPDVIADLHEITYPTAVELEKIGPFGIGNPKPIVQIMQVKVNEVHAMGSGGSHLSLKVGGKFIRCVWWSHGNLVNQIARGSRIDIVGKIKTNEFRGQHTAEIDIIDLKLPSS